MLTSAAGRRSLRRVVAWSVVNVVGCVVFQAATEFLVTDVLRRLKSLLLVEGEAVGVESFAESVDDG